MISIVIVNYNVANHLNSCINSIYKSDIGEPFEIIVVDNNSTEKINLSKLFDLNQENNVKLIQLNNNKGFAHAVNEAVSASSGATILLLNPDTLVKNNTIDILYKYLISNNDVGVVGCKVTYPSGKYQLSSKRCFPSLDISLIKLFYFFDINIKI